MTISHDSAPIDEGLHRRALAVVPPGQTISVEDDSTFVRLAELGLDVPSFAVLPRNFLSAGSPEHFVFEASTSAIVTLGRRAGLAITIPGTTRYRTINEKDAEYIAPVLQVSHAFLIDGGTALVVAFLEHLARHVRKRRGPGARHRHVAFELAVTEDRKSKRLIYSGPLEGLSEIVQVARKVFDDAK